MPIRSGTRISPAFTLIELLIVVSIIGILAGLAAVVLNPNKYLSDSRNLRRHVDLHTISMAVYQYTLDTTDIPSTITNTETEICRKEAADCSGLVDLTSLLAEQKYLVELPIDPKSYTTNSTGYAIYRSEYGRVTVSAPHAENGERIEVTR